MHYPLTDIQADFEINRLIRYQITAKRNYFPRRTDGQPDRRTDNNQGWQFLPLSGNFRKKLRKKWKGRNTFFRGRNGRNGRSGRNEIKS